MRERAADAKKLVETLRTVLPSACDAGRRRGAEQVSVAATLRCKRRPASALTCRASDGVAASLTAVCAAAAPG